ncbi:MAG: FAD-dependent oxidoreductase [Erysipelotrichales bacterium]|nr:FAD-dependent oxidoreductase [Erysipelotrichales bacterium]
MPKIECLIIGKGPAGISLAIYLKRAGFNCLVIGKDYGALAEAETVANYYGLPEPISGEELIERGILQAQNLGIEIRTDEVLNIVDMVTHFEVKLLDQVVSAKTVVMALGKKRERLKIKGFEEFIGKGISFCATCDGFFYRGKKLAVIGSRDYALSEYEELTSFSQDLTLFTNGEVAEFRNNNVELKLNNEKIIEIKGDVRVKEILTERTSYSVEGIFVALKSAGPLEFAKKLGVLTENNFLVVNQDYMTNIKGIFAIGDCIGGLPQIAKAVADGAIASKGIINYLKTKENKK